MSEIEQIEYLAKVVLNDKDFKLISKFIDKHDFNSFIEIVESEIKKEYKLCEPESMTERYCTLQDLYFLLQKYDTREKDINDLNYEEEIDGEYR